MPKTVTMQHVADAAGVSRMSVSLALRHSRSISPTTRARIEAVAKRLGYRPNPLVSTLMAARSGGKDGSASYPLAILDLSTGAGWPDKALFSQKMFKGICDRSGALGFSAQVFRPPRPGAEGMAALHRIFYTRNIRGIIVAPVGAHFQIPNFPWKQYCCVSLGYSLIEPPMHAVASKQYGNALLLYQHLHECGYRRPGIVTSEAFEIRTRYHASAALHTHCRTHPEVVEIPTLHLDPPGSTKGLKSWLRSYRPDVLISGSDLSLMIRNLGMDIPGDIGFAILNTLTADHEKPEISGLDILPWHIGASAVELVVAHLHRNDFGLPECPSVVMVSGRFYQGKTTRQLKKKTRRKASSKDGPVAR